ncbi:hypothetical protein FHW23_002040 [Curtobacterium pusillum]|uniref:Uncharacterized protein n=1 Tax=Curtobacterium pusillum TaxID=69373 RepID=A0AAW3T7T1_9MICO|nr:hypothetical protein [Curtobacterium pusillum]MBA8990775.1 hypothetical protein [Curtobacterium pusillum]
MFRVLGAFAAAATALFLGFAAQSVHDTQSMATIRSALIITHVSENAPVPALLRAEASTLRANFYQVRIDPTGRTPVRTLAPIIGDPSTHERAFPSGRYAAFNRSLTTKLTRAPDSPLGAYFSTLSPRALDAVAKQLAAAGVDAHVEAMNWGGLVSYMLAYTPLMLAAAVAVGAAWLAGLARALARAREQAVLRVHGVRAPVIRDVVTSALFAVAAYAVSAGAAILMINAYNGGHQIQSYCTLSAVLLGIFVAAFSCGTCVPGMLPRSLRFRSAFSSWRPWARGRLTTAAVQVATLTLVIFLTAQAAAAWGSLVNVRDSGPDWKGCSACTVTIFNGFGGQSALNDAVTPYASAVRALEPQGKVVLSWARGAVQGEQYTPGDPDSNVIIANPTFLARSESRLPNPLRGIDGPGEWGLLVPSDRADRAEAIAQEWLESFREPLGDVPNPAVPKQPHIATYPAGAVFNYGQTDLRDKVYSTSPVIVVVSASAGLLDDDSYFAAGSSGDLLFTEDASATRHALDKAGVERSVYSLDTLGTQIARGITTAQSRLSVAIAGAAVGLVALIGMLTIRTRVRIMSRRHQILLLRTEGLSPARVQLMITARTLALLTGTGLVILIAGSSGLVGSDIPPSTLAVAAAAASIIVIATNALITARLTTMKELITNAR